MFVVVVIVILTFIWDGMLNGPNSPSSWFVTAINVPFAIIYLRNVKKEKEEDVVRPPDA